MIRNTEQLKKKYVFHLKHIVLFLTLLPLCGYSQTYINDSHINEDEDYEICGDIVSPETGDSVINSGTSKVTYSATGDILLSPGFRVTGLTGTGRFKATLWDISTVVYPENFSGTAGIFERFEIGLKMPDSIETKIKNYMNLEYHDPYPSNYSGLNPFNPDDISVEVFFYPPSYPTTPIKKVFGFYYQDYEYIELDTTFTHDYWAEKETDYNWRVRFAPDMLGTWNYLVTISFINNPELSTIILPKCQFECVSSGNPGFVRPDSINPTLFSFSGSGEMFFGNGINIAWGNTAPDLNTNPVFYTAPPMRQVDNRDDFRKAASYGCNMVRFMIRPRIFDYHWEELGYYDSDLQITSELIDDDDLVGRMALAWELDSLIFLCEDLGIYTIACQQYQHNYNHYTYNDPGDRFTWDNNPYDTIPSVDDAWDFLSNNTAKYYYKNWQRYLLARWGYTTNIIGHELFNEVEQIGCIIDDDNKSNSDDYEKGCKSCYYNDSIQGLAFRDTLTKWHNEMYDYIRNDLDFSNHLISTSRGGYPKENDSVYQLADFCSTHPYTKNRAEKKNRYKNYLKYFLKDTVLNDKPFIFGEGGLQGSYSFIEQQDTFYCSRLNTYYCSDVGFHREMWESAMMKTASTGLNWWWRYLLDEEESDTCITNISKLNNFFSQEPIHSNSLEFTEIQTSYDDYDTDDTVDYVLTKTTYGELIYGWISNNTVDWKRVFYGTTFGDCMYPGNWNYNGCIPDNPPIESSDE
ncbi:MAG: hypothetical protein R2764_02675 [Bacteroidales bacterium]